MDFPHRMEVPCRPGKHAAFTLVEIAMAIGIFAFAIVAIFSLFPVGLRSANESRIQSVVTQIARTVLSDLRTGPFNAARVAVLPLPNDSAVAGGTAFTPFDLSAAAPTPVYVLYMADGKTAKKLANAAAYNSGDATGDYIVKIESSLVVTTDPKLAQVTVTVEAPASAPVANRGKYPVVTLMGDTR